MPDWILIAVAQLFALGLLALALVAALWRRPAAPRRHAVFVRAPAQTVWDAYFMHVKRAEYRPGRRILDIETLSQSPLTIRATIQMDYLSTPSVVTYAFPLYQPPYRWRIEAPGNDRANPAEGMVEEGEMVEQDGGTWLRCSIRSRRRAPLVRWLAGRRVRANLRALAAYCEGRKLPPQRTPLRLSWAEVVLFWLALGCIAVPAPTWLMLPALCFGLPLMLWRVWQIARRFL